MCVKIFNYPNIGRGVEAGEKKERGMESRNIFQAYFSTTLKKRRYGFSSHAFTDS